LKKEKEPTLKDEMGLDFANLPTTNIKYDIEPNMFPFDSFAINNLKVKPR